MSIARKPTLTPQQYLAIEREAEHRSEYHAGQMFPMAGASEAHILITANLAAELRAQLRDRPCRIYPIDMKVKVSDTGLYTYPDVGVACGEIQFEDERRDVLLNPVVLVEVLSPSTEKYDRGEKFFQYRRLPSLREFVLVAQDHARVEHYLRQGDAGQWLLTEYEGLDAVLELPVVGVRVPLSEIYRNVELPPRSSESGVDPSG